MSSLKQNLTGFNSGTMNDIDFVSGTLRRFRKVDVIVLSSGPASLTHENSLDLGPRVVATVSRLVGRKANFFVGF